MTTPVPFTAVGYQAAAQHTCTSCDGFHGPGRHAAWADWLAGHDKGSGTEYDLDDLEAAYKDGFSAGAAYRDFTKGPPA